MPSNLITEITLQGVDLKALVGDLRQKITIAEEFKTGSWSLDIRDSNDAYFMIPDQLNQDYPWPGASQVYLPLIRANCDSIHARHYDATLSNTPFMKVRATKDKAPFHDSADDLSFYYGEHYYRKEVPFKRIASDFMMDTIINGTAILKNRIDHSQILRRQLIPREVGIRGRPPAQGLGEKAIEFLGQTVRTATGRKETVWDEEIYLEETRKVLIENTSIEQIFVPPFCGPSLQWPECPWYYEEHFLTIQQLLSRAGQGYDLPDLEKLKGMAVERAPTEGQQSAADAAGLSETRNLKKVEMLEFYMRLALPAEVKFAMVAGQVKALKGDKIRNQGFMDEEDSLEEEVVVSYLPQIGRVVRIVPLDRLRSDGKRPHVDMRYRRVSRMFHGQGVPAFMLELNLASNALVNQWINNGELQNLPWLFFNPDTMGDIPENMYLEPGAMIPTADPRGVNAIKLQGDGQFYMSGLNFLFAQAERMGTSDFSQGLSPTRPNAPDTARATLAIMGAEQVSTDAVTGQFTDAFIEEFEHVHELHRLNVKEPIKFEFFNPDSQAFETRTVGPEHFAQPVDFEFILNPNRQSEQQANQALFGMLSEVIMAARGSPDALWPLAKDLWTSFGKDNFEEIWAKPAPATTQSGLPGAAPPQAAVQAPPVPQEAPINGDAQVQIPGKPFSVPLAELAQQHKLRFGQSPSLSVEEESITLRQPKSAGPNGQELGAQ